MNHNPCSEWMETATGRVFYPLAPLPRDIELDDIAISLSNQCRFGGQMEPFYSVAQHCIHVSKLVPKEFALQALLHDAAEAYIVDLPTPLKRCLTQYKAIENGILEAIALRFGHDPDWLTNLPEVVRYADKVALMTERRDLKAPSGMDWGINVLPHPEHLVPLTPSTARGAFLRRAQLLTKHL